MGQTPISTQTACAHCGEDCIDDRFREEALSFCCYGCQTVFHLLRDNGLDQFYRLDERAGRSQKGLPQVDYQWLDEPELCRSFIQYQDDQRLRVQLDLPAIHCTSCVWLLENLARLHTGVISVQVNFGLKRATILFAQQEISFRELAELLARIGYPPRFRKQGEGGKQHDPAKRRLLYQIGLAGFVFGNVMLFSFPEYLGLGIDLAGGRFERLFGYLNLLLTLPVLIYSGRDYLLSAYRGLREGVTTVDLPISLGILALFGRSTYEVLSQTGAGYFDSLAGLLFFLLIGKWFQGRTFARLSFDNDYRAYFPVAARRFLSSGETQAVALEQIEIGDRLQIRPGDLIPVDGVLASTVPVGIDYSFVTGESLPQSREDGAQVYAGGRATEQAFELVASRAVEQSYLLQLWREKENIAGGRSRNLTDKASKYFTITVLLIALGTLLYWWPIDAGTAVYAATSVLIIACPCALALAIPFTYGAILQVLGRHGLYLRGVQVIERMQGIRHFIFDKTGTLSLPTGGELPLLRADWSPEQQSRVLTLCQHSRHPKSRMLAAQLRRSGVAAAVLDEPIEEISGQGLRSGDIRVGKAEFCGLAATEVGLEARLCVSEAGRCLALFGEIREPLRPDWSTVLESCGEYAHLYLLSGDHPPSVQPWREQIPADHCHFEQSPFDKRDFVRRLQNTAAGGVAMLGDGLNDAGALQVADLSVAVSEDQSSFSPASDAILAGSAFGQFGELMKFVRTSRSILYLAFTTAIMYNFIGLFFAVQGELAPVIAAILMPVSSVSIVVIGVLGVYAKYWLSSIYNSDYLKVT